MEVIVSIVGLFHAMSLPKALEARHEQPALVEEEEHLVGRAQPQKALEDEGDAVLDLQVGVFVDETVFVAHQSGGQFECQFPALGLAHYPGSHPG